jgi:hypothetical protein
VKGAISSMAPFASLRVTREWEYHGDMSVKRRS